MVIVFCRVTSARNNPLRLLLMSVRSSSVSVIYFQARRMDRDFVEEHELRVPLLSIVAFLRSRTMTVYEGEISVALARIKRTRVEGSI